MTPEDFDRAISRFEAAPGGEVHVTDVFPHGRAPYRAGHLTIRVSREAPQGGRVAELVAQFAILALEVCAYLTMNVHPTGVQIGLQIMRELDPDEIGDDPPVATRDVSR